MLALPVLVLLTTQTFANEIDKANEFNAPLETIVSFDTTTIKNNIDSIRDVIQYIDIKGSVMASIEWHTEMSEKIMSTDFSELNEAIANNFVESIEIKPERKRNFAFAWWNCTYYVAKNKKVTWSWNARDWLKNAKASWEATGNVPQAGAIIVFIWGGYSHYGHVGIVHKVNEDGTLYISDMNYSWLNKITYRTIPQNKAIAWYIYVD